VPKSSATSTAPASAPTSANIPRATTPPRRRNRSRSEVSAARSAALPSICRFHRDPAMPTHS